MGLDPAYLRKLRANRTAWDFFQSRPPGYRHLCIRWVMEAKQAPTRQRRLAALIAACARGVAIPPLTGRPGGKPRA